MREKIRGLDDYFINDSQQFDPQYVWGLMERALRPELNLNIGWMGFYRVDDLVRTMENFHYDEPCDDATLTRAGHVISLAVTLWDIYASEAGKRVAPEVGKVREFALDNAIRQQAREIAKLKAQAATDAVTIEALRNEVMELSKHPQNERRRVGYVYLVASGNGSYKIGRTRKPEDRMKTFKTKLPFDVEYLAIIQTDDMYTLEAELHARFADKRLNGSEFFQLDNDDIAYIVGMAQESKE